MISCLIPGRAGLEIQHLVCDVNGTLACDGKLLPGVEMVLSQLKDLLKIHLVSADTYGTLNSLEDQLGSIVIRYMRLKPWSEAEQKLEYVENLDAPAVVAIGQGTNDRLMLKAAGLGICVLSPEGTAVETMLNADILAPDILTALDLLLHPDRMKATLRQ